VKSAPPVTALDVSNEGFELHTAPLWPGMWCETGRAARRVPIISICAARRTVRVSPFHMGLDLYILQTPLAAFRLHC